MPEKDTLIIAQSQQRPVPLDVKKMLAQLTQTVQQAADWGVQLLVVPEMSMTGYNVQLHDMRGVAEPSDGDLYRSVATLARQHRMAIAYGYAERHGDAFYNSVQLVDEQGNGRLYYRKTHLWGNLDRGLFTAGDALSDVVDIAGWRVGAAICYDIEFPETTRHLALQGAELIIVPTGLMQPWREVATKVIPVRAYENRLFMAYTNYCGSEGDLNYEGYSCIVDPNGDVLASALDKPVLLTATLQREVIIDARAALPYLSNRRPELYQRLTMKN